MFAYFFSNTILAVMSFFPYEERDDEEEESSSESDNEYRFSSLQPKEKTWQDEARDCLKDYGFNLLEEAVKNLSNFLYQRDDRGRYLRSVTCTCPDKNDDKHINTCELKEKHFNFVALSGGRYNISFGDFMPLCELLKKVADVKRVHPNPWDLLVNPVILRKDTLSERILACFLMFADFDIDLIFGGGEPTLEMAIFIAKRIVEHIISAGKSMCTTWDEDMSAYIVSISIKQKRDELWQLKDQYKV